MRKDQEARKKMLVCGNGDEKWREKMMEGEDSLRTVECLRGRLLAERVASKAAKEDAEFMGNKLIELEKQLRLETELKNKAEKKLKFLKKKMESLKLSPISDDRSSSTTFSGSKEPEEQNSDSQIAQQVKCSTAKEEISDISTSKSIQKDNSEYSLSDPDHQMTSTIRSSSSVGTAHSRNNSEVPSLEEPSSKIKDSPREESTKDNFRQTSIDEKEFQREDNPGEFVDNTLALVPASLWPTSQTSEPQINNQNVLDVLAALRHAREQLQNSTRKDFSRSRSVGFCGI
ncbi:hypothetical protein BVC80_1835g642 [Macleaya cordata]|uniref:Uncharacterized protein n=1 Tax=Macleaya cordata TaxID=56857 RepID=A0A200R6A0_MACCD|nr:hypothetical protein BVC80_1835g642 [Macleaya cordata]